MLKNDPAGQLVLHWILADNVATGAEFAVYAPNGGTFTVNFSATTRTLSVEWLNPSSGAITTGGTIAEGQRTNPSLRPSVAMPCSIYVDAGQDN